MKHYQILIHPQTKQRITDYLAALQDGSRAPGNYLRAQLEGHRLSDLKLSQFVEYLLNTKRPQIFAESAVYGDGRDWTQEELSILGDIGIAVPVTVFDNGEHNSPVVHAVPFEATLLFVAGALLRNDKGLTPADWEEVTRNDQLDKKAFYNLYERRLLPSFLFANEFVVTKKSKAFITIPGIGCGQFAGKFRGRLEIALQEVLVELLRRNADRLLNIKAVYYDPYQTSSNERLQIEHLSFFVRPLKQGNDHKPQLCPPTHYAESGDDFSGCRLFSFVAWDHVSWPGNDFWTGARTTDDGVKAAATNTMAVMTGIDGSYSRQSNKYDPPAGYRSWNDVVHKNKLKIHAGENIIV